MARARRERTTGALLMLDLDHFKQVNDTHGHPAGDQLIVEVAEVLRRRTRESDILARLGGDEFAVVLPRCTVRRGAAGRRSDRRGDPRARARARRRRADHRQHRRRDVRRRPAHERRDSIVSEADTAMYAAKDGGRDGVRVFDRRRDPRRRRRGGRR